jgi:phenylpyruvate tautomerase PptA (4-oxalocrotonate tautomerase family)
MPVLQVYYPQGSLQGGRKAALAQRLTDVLLMMEGGAKTPGGMAFAAVLFTEVPATDWWVGGRTDATYVAPPGKFLIRVDIPEGYMNRSHKSDVHAAVNKAIVDLTGDPSDPKQGASVLVIVNDVTEGNWGARGRTISLAAIADSVGLAKTGERFKWVRNYFAAKARQFGAPGYPPDTGGLLPSESEAEVRSA